MNREERLLDICADVMNVDRSTITLETTRKELEEFDSLSIVQILAELEEAFSTANQGRNTAEGQDEKNQGLFKPAGEVTGPNR